MITPLDIFSLETWILIATVLIFIRLYIHKKWQVLKNLNVPHDPPSILGFGHLKLFFKDTDKSFFSLDAAMKEKYGKIYGFYFGLSPRITIADPEILKQIYIKEFSNFRDRQKTGLKLSGKEMNSGLTNVTGEQWKRIRSTISPTFSTSKLKEMFGIIDECADQLVASLRKIYTEKEGKFHPKEIFGKYSMDVICSAAFSTKVQCQGDEETMEIKMAKRLFNRKALFKNPVFLFFALCPWAEPLAELLDYSAFDKQMLRYYKRLTDELIKNKNTSQKSRVDIMQTMLKSEINEEEVKKGAIKGLTRTEIVGNSILMILGGYETTANSLLFLTYCLAWYEDSQEKIAEEIEETLREKGKLTYDGVNKMRHLDMCMKESQRMYGAVAKNARACEEDITINGILIPKGIVVDVPVYAMAHDEEYWDEPYKFKPERFEDMSKIDPMVFQPFGAGPRNCIGMRFAIMEMKVGICKLLQNFKIDVCEETPTPPLKLAFTGSVVPKDEVILTVTPRHDGMKT